MNQTQIDPELAGKLRRSIAVPVFAFLMVGLAAVALYLLAAFFAFDLLHRAEAPSRFTIGLYRIVALAVILFGLPVMLLSIRVKYHLIRHGVQTTARVVGVGPVSKNGLRPVTFAYLVGNREVQVMRDTPQMYIDRYTERTVLPVVYDPRHPKWCEVFRFSPREE